MEQDLKQAIDDFAQKINQHPVVPKLLKGWNKAVRITASGSGDCFTMVIANKRVEKVIEGQTGADILISGPGDVLAGIFRGRLNPAKEYARGNVKFTGSAKDEMKIDAIIQMVWG